MFVIKDARARVLLDDGTWQHMYGAEEPFKLFPTWQRAKEARDELGEDIEHPPATIKVLQSEYEEQRTLREKQQRREKKSLRSATLIPLVEPETFYGVEESELEMIFSQFQVTHLIVSDRCQVIGVMGKTDDDERPYYSYAGDDFYWVFCEERCYSRSAPATEVEERVNWQQEGL